MNQIPNIEEEFANKLSSSIRYSSGKGQYDAFPDCQDAYLDGVETAIAMMYIDLTGTPKSEGMLAKFLHQQLQKAREENADKLYGEGYYNGVMYERERIEAIFKEHVPPHAMDLEDSVWLKRLLNKAFGHENLY